MIGWCTGYNYNGFGITNHWVSSLDYRGVMAFVQGTTSDLDRLWEKHAKNLVAEGVTPRRTAEWETSTRRLLRIYFWLDIATI